MGSQNEKEKRDYVTQVYVITEQNTSRLTDVGFDPANRLTQLQTKRDEANSAEGRQKEIQAEAMAATKVANEKLDDAYKDASAVVSLIEGLLGKDDPLVHKLRTLRS
ncbi:hypothetical protein [Draconibacterium sediminis]|uniref:Uncharacterized protein n=1 Tax=Draconibacterium sediminis TaxID=1544798 RepID=A0A0D8JBL7_9BACT|nr:hypothetical protein [Draconibacterium sediminis]KJF44292.1 hypothetical protein LH29_01905 [Draconibacterium sediminis]